MSWWPLPEMRIARFLRTLVCAGALVLPLRAATAAETGGCESFAWPLSTEIAWMNASESETILSGAKLAAPPNNAIDDATADGQGLVFRRSHRQSEE